MAVGEGHDTSSPLIDANILHDKRVLLVKELHSETILACVKSLLHYSEVDTINAEQNRGSRIGKLIDCLELRVAGKSYEAYNVFILTIAGTQPKLFETLSGRHPTYDEANFCVENYVKGTKECIKNVGHSTDSPLDEKIDLDCEHIQLMIVNDESDTAKFDDLPHRYQYYLSNIQDRQESIPALEVLGDRRDTPQIVSLHGRAGIGKTTTFQWLSRQWAFGQWATQFTLLFLLQLRMLCTTDCPVTAIEMLTEFSLFQVTEENLVCLVSSWLKNSARQVILLIDGLDEIAGFSAHLQSCRKITDLKTRAHPIDLCINILRGDLLPGCTIVTTSRPFSGLSALHFHRKLEILGLTEHGVKEFVQLKHSTKVHNVMSVLRESPILMSICGISFYCALITRLLAEDIKFASDDLQTYTRLTAFIIVQYVSRKLSTDSTFLLEVRSYFPKMARMAFKGMFERQIRGELSKLIFNDYDIGQVGLTAQELKSIQNIGLLQTKKVQMGKREHIIAEFIHLSVQELLSAAHLLTNFPTSDNVLWQLFSGGQFNMSYLYLFGLRYDTRSDWIKVICQSIDSYENTKPQISDFLEELCQNCQEDKDFLLKLQICQLLHESQLEDKARSIASDIAPKGRLNIKHTHMTIIDLMAIRFVCKHLEKMPEIIIKWSNFNNSLMQFFTSSILEDHAGTIHTLQLTSNLIGNEGVKAIGEWLHHNDVLQYLDVSENSIEGDGAKALADVLHANSSLNTLNISHNNIGQFGAKSLAEALYTNTKLETLFISGNNIGESGAKALADVLYLNRTLKRLDNWSNNIGDTGAIAFADVLYHNDTLLRLNIGVNNICESGAMALAEALHNHSTFESLTIGANRIGEAGTKALTNLRQSRSISVNGLPHTPTPSTPPRGTSRPWLRYCTKTTIIIQLSLVLLLMFLTLCYTLVL